MDSAEQKSGTQTGGNVLRRMIAERDRMRTPQQNAAVAAQSAAEVSQERAAATALGRAAERLHKLPVFVEKAEYAAMSTSEIAELLPERALLAVVESGRDLLGVMALCPDFLGALIEMQALGRVTARSPAPRRPTRTDAVISADFVNAFLAELGRELGRRPGYPEFDRYRYATYLDDPRPLALMLEDGAMMRLTLKFRIGAGGRRDGTLMLALPVPAARPDDATPGRMLAGPDRTALPAADPAPTLAVVMQDAPVRLMGVLCRRTISLRTLRGLAPGALIPLGPNALDEARLETVSGQVVVHGRLGEADGFHAIRLRAEMPGRAGDGSDVPGPEVLMPAPQAFEPPLADMNRPDAFRGPTLAATGPSAATR